MISQHDHEGISKINIVPDRLVFLTPVWGRPYLETLFRHCIPSLLSPGNLPEIADFAVDFVFLTKAADVKLLEAADSIAALRRFGRVTVTTIDNVPASSNQELWSKAYDIGQRLYDSEAGRVGFFFMCPDGLWADGTMRTFGQRIREGYRAVTCLPVRVNDEEFIAAIDPRYRDLESGALVVPPRDMARIWFRHRHAQELGQTIGRSTHIDHPARIYWDVAEGIVLAKSFGTHPYYCFPRRLSNVTDVIGTRTTTIDHVYLSLIDIVPSEIFVVTDSDDLMIVDLAPPGLYASMHRPGPIETGHVVDWLRSSEWCGPLQMFYTGFTFLYRDGEVTDGLDCHIAEADAFIAVVLDENRRRDSFGAGPWRHPYDEDVLTVATSALLEKCGGVRDASMAAAFLIANWPAGRVLFYGASTHVQGLLGALPSELRDRVVAIVDRAADLIGRFCDLPVITPSRAAGLDGAVVIVVHPFWERDMMARLQIEGMPAARIMPVYDNPLFVAESVPAALEGIVQEHDLQGVDAVIIANAGFYPTVPDQQLIDILSPERTLVIDMDQRGQGPVSGLYSVVRCFGSMLLMLRLLERIRPARIYIRNHRIERGAAMTFLLHELLPGASIVNEVTRPFPILDELFMADATDFGLKVAALADTLGRSLLRHSDAVLVGRWGAELSCWAKEAGGPVLHFRPEAASPLASRLSFIELFSIMANGDSSWICMAGSGERDRSIAAADDPFTQRFPDVPESGREDLDAIVQEAFANLAATGSDAVPALRAWVREAGYDALQGAAAALQKRLYARNAATLAQLAMLWPISCPDAAELQGEGPFCSGDAW